MKAPIVIRPTAVTAEIRTPAMITGRASGSCTFLKIWPRLIPIPLADSMVCGSMSAMPM